MTTDQQLVDVTLRQWKTSIDRFESYFAGLTDEQLEQEVAPGRNRLIYLLGHLAGVHDRMLPLLDAGPRRYEHLDAIFLTSPDRAVASIPPAGELREAFLESNKALWEAFAKWSPADWLARHTAVSEEDFAKEPHRNRFSVLLSRLTHLTSHYGQVTLVKLGG